MPETKYFLDAAGLARFKTKQDAANEAKFLGIHAKADTAGAADTAAEATHAAAADTATKLAAAVTINGVDFDGSKSITINAVDATPRIAASEKGAINGVATLDAAGKVPSSQLPSYVDDVKEFENKAAFPETGEADKIYVDIATGDIYRWSGTQYIRINSSVASADTAVKLATARNIAGVPFDGSADITIPAGNVGAFTKEETNTTFLSKADAAATYVAKVAGKDLSDNNFTTELLTKLNGIEAGANRYVLPQASSTVLGGVTVGNNITVNTGTISVSKENVIAALGYTPSDSAAEVPVEAISDSEIDKLFASTGK